MNANAVGRRLARQLPVSGRHLRIDGDLQRVLEEVFAAVVETPLA